MSAAVSTSRATSRTSKEKQPKPTTVQQLQTKTDGTPTKVQPTAEQLRIAQITSGQDETDLATINQLMEMTGKNQDQVAVALHDCENDLERAVLMLLEGENDQGEWKEQGKKKKRTNPPAAPTQKTEPVSNHVSERSENRRDRSREVETSERHDGPPRRGRRNGGPPPRLARGRGRDRNNYFGGDRNEDGENERGGSFRDRDHDGFRDRDHDGFKDRDGFRDKDGAFRDRENGFGGFGRDRERSGDRGRGRGRGNFGGRRGRGRGGNFRSGQGQRFEKGPQIDTWTNETAEIAEKEPSGWGETWTTEDWNDDSWQGNLTETKVFTASTVKVPEPDLTAPPVMNDTANTMGSASLGQTNAIGQRLDLGSLLQKTAENTSNDSYIAQFNQQATESIKNTIGIGSSPRQNHSNLSSQSSASAMNSYSQNMQQASTRVPTQQLSQGMPSQSMASQVMPSQGLSSAGLSAQGLSQGLAAQSLASQSLSSQGVTQPGISSQALSSQGLSSHGMSSQGLSSHSMSQGLPSQGIPSQGMPSQGMSPPGLSSQGLSSHGITSQGQHVQSSLQQRPKPQRSKLPPPSKIPASAVEMPGHVMPQLDVQFGVDFGAESSPFSFGSSDSPAPPTSFSNTTASSTTPMNTHLGQVSKSAETVMPSSVMSSPGSKQPSISNLEQSSPRSSVFQNVAYTSPPRKETQSPLNQPKMTPPDPIPFPPSQSDRKSSPMMGSQHPAPASTALAQGSLAGAKTDSSSLSSYVQSTGNYQSAGYQGHKPSYTHTSSQAGSYQSPYQTSQNQYQSGQNQYQTGQNQYQTGQNQYQTGANQYQGYPSGTSFQTQSNYSSSQSNPNSLYQTAAQTSSYQTQSGSYHVRDTQSSMPRQPSTNQSNASSYQNQASSLTSPSTQSQSGYSSQSYSSSGHQSNLQTSPLTGNKLGDSLSKMTLKDSISDNTSSQYDHTTVSTTTPSLTTTTSSALSTATPTVTSTCVSSLVSSSSRSSLPSNTKAPPNLPPGVPVLSHQYIMGQGTMPPFYVSNPNSLQQPLYGYEDMQLLQQRLPMASNYYDMGGFPVPSTISGREQATLGNIPYSGTTDTSKLNRVEAQSPNPSTQQQSSQSAHQPFINLHYGYYYPSMLPGAAGFQYPTMFPMPPVTNTAHAGTTATSQFQKSYVSHGYNAAKAYEDLTQAQDFSKTGYGAAPTQTKGSAATRSATTDLAGTAYGKSHTQAFDKQFHAGTPPPFNLPMATASQAGPMGAPTTPYGAPFVNVPMMAHQPHSQMLHHPLQQDTTGGSSRASQQATSQVKAGSKAYGAYCNWGAN